MLKKQILSLALIVCLAFPCALTANAQAGNAQTGSTVVPYWSYTSSTRIGLTISAAGSATCEGVITGYQGITTKVSIYLYLQQYKNGNWTTINSWYNSFNSYRGSLAATAIVAKGYQYRVMASYYAYSGTNYENIVDYSDNVIY